MKRNATFFTSQTLKRVQKHMCIYLALQPEKNTHTPRYTYTYTELYLALVRPTGISVVEASISFGRTWAYAFKASCNIWKQMRAQNSKLKLSLVLCV